MGGYGITKTLGNYFPLLEPGLVRYSQLHPHPAIWFWNYYSTRFLSATMLIKIRHDGHYQVNEDQTS